VVRKDHFGFIMYIRKAAERLSFFDLIEALCQIVGQTRPAVFFLFFTGVCIMNGRLLKKERGSRNMNRPIISWVQQRMAVLEGELGRVEKALGKAPEKVVHLSYSHGSPQFYLCEPGNKNGHYVRKTQYTMVRKILQKEYDERVRLAILQEMKALRGLMEQYPSTAMEEVYETIVEAKRGQIVPRFQSDREYAEEWVKREYTTKGIRDEEGRIFTERGETVRSKSEKMIADKLLRMKIPYRYECPLTFSNGHRIYPDFTLLDIEKREEIYLEHMGMLDNPAYAENAVTRLNWYAQEGIFPGKGLILTWETMREPFDVRMLDGMLADFEPYPGEM